MVMLARRAMKKHASGGGGSPTLVQQNTAGSSSSASTRTITLPSVTAGRGLVLSYAQFNGGVSSGSYASAISGITDSASNTWTRAVAYNGTTTVGQVELWYCLSSAASAGTLTVTVTITSPATACNVAMNLSNYSKALTGVRATNTASGTATSQSATVTSASGDLVLAAQSRFDNVNEACSTLTPLTFVTGTSVSDASAYGVASTTSTTATFAAGSSVAIGTAIASFTN